MTPSQLSLLYQENAKIASIFWEWRHKIMTGLFAIIVALFTLSGWLYQNRAGKATAVPLFFGFILCLTAILLDWRNARILKACYSFGQKIEKKIGENDGIFTLIDRAQRLTYTTILRVVYLLIGLLLLGLSYTAYYHSDKPVSEQITVDGSTLPKIPIFRAAKVICNPPFTNDALRVRVGE